MNPRTFLIQGLIAGLLAGIFAFGVAHQVGEQYVNEAIAVEDAGAAAHPHGTSTPAHPHDMSGTVVSRQNQSTWGLLTATVAIGVAIGGIVGLISAFAVGRLGRIRPAASTALVAAIGFVSFALVPWAKYPANPPSVGKAATIGSRTAEYFAFLGISIVLAIVAVVIAGRLYRSRDAWVAVVLPGLGWLVLVTIAGFLLPTVNEVPADFPASTLWGFRLSAILTQATMWGVIGIALSGLVNRTFKAQEARRQLIESIS